MNEEEEERARFELWIISEPAMSIDRFPDNAERYAWPGHYVCIDVQFAWLAWQEAIGGER